MKRRDLGRWVPIAALAVLGVVLLAVLWDYLITLAAVAAVLALLWVVLLRDWVRGVPPWTEPLPGEGELGGPGPDATDVGDGTDPDACRACGGECCLIYLPLSEGGVMPDDADPAEHARSFHAATERGDTEPLFDARRVHAEKDAAYFESLLEIGINPYFCEYWGDDGCRLPRDRRPSQCLSYTCRTLDESLAGGHGVASPEGD